MDFSIQMKQTSWEMPPHFGQENTIYIHEFDQVHLIKEMAHLPLAR